MNPHGLEISTLIFAANCLGDKSKQNETN